jgi:DNA recombination protein RmuC
MLLYLAVGVSTLAAIFALLAFLAALRRSESSGVPEEIAQLIRTEFDRIRSDSADQARGARQELTDNLRGFQTATLQSFTGLGGQLGEQIREFEGKLDAGLRVIDERAAGIGAKLDQELERLSQRATQSGQALKEMITARLDDSAAKAATAARELREELSRTVATLQDSLDTHLSTVRDGAAQQAQLLRTEVINTVKQSSDTMIASLGQMSAAQREHFAAFASRLLEFFTTAQTGLDAVRESVHRHLIEIRDAETEHAQLLRQEVGSTIKDLTDQMAAGQSDINNSLHQSLIEMVTAGDMRHRAIVQTLDEKTSRLSEASSEASRSLREELTQNVQGLGNTLTDALTHIGTHQRERLEELTRALVSLTEGHVKAQEALRNAVEGRLDAIRTESANKLDDLRRTVDEKLHMTLEKRLGESFRIVTEQLERVYQGLGEMQSLAAGVGDLKRVLSNVKVRGTWGEIQLRSLLEQFLAPDQYQRNVQVRDDSSERVEFAIRLPGRDGEHEVWLPIDAKFPHEDFERLTVAAENGDATGVEQAAAALEEHIKGCARSIKEKYINPPRTTDIAILFLPTESLYAEILRRPGVFEQLQYEYHVALAGPTTLTAILNALQIGFRSLAIEKRTSEVWQVLGAIKSEFGKYGEVIKRLHRQLNTAVNTVDTLGTRTRVMSRKLREVEVMPEAAAEALLGIDSSDAEDRE